MIWFTASFALSIRRLSAWIQNNREWCFKQFFFKKVNQGQQLELSKKYTYNYAAQSWNRKKAFCKLWWLTNLIIRSCEIVSFCLNVDKFGWKCTIMTKRCDSWWTVNDHLSGCIRSLRDRRSSNSFRLVIIFEWVCLILYFQFNDRIDPKSIDRTWQIENFQSKTVYFRT